MSTENRIKILIVDDSVMTREGLNAILGNFSDFEVVGQASNGQIAVTMCSEYWPDVILMDISMPLMDGIQATALILKSHAKTQVIALTNVSSNEPIQNMLKAGAISYLDKNISIYELVTAIRQAYAGTSTLSLEATTALISTMHPQPELGHDLSQREREVLRLMAEGLNNNAIGTNLGISRSTVKNHLSNIFSKLGAANRVQAVAITLQYGLLVKSS
ncbi:MAG: response regulator transcription factor [Chloroflexota bacterium]